MDAPMRAVDNELAPAISQQPGFIGFFALDDDGGTLTMISIFEDRAAAARSDELSAAFVDDRLDQLGLSGAEVSSGEVMVGRVTPHALRDAHPGTAPADGRSASAEAVSQRPVLVVGATGRTGRLIVDRLLAMGVSVHALLRDAPKRREPLPSGVRQFTGDVRNSQTLIAPMEGVGAVIIVSSGGTEHRNSAELVDYFGTSNLVLQAAMSNVGLVVLVSTLGATRPAHAMDVEPTSLGWKARAEEVIRRSGVPYCIVRCGWLTDGPGGEPLSLSQGDAIDGRLSRRDLADLLTRLLFLPQARGKTIDVVEAAGSGSGSGSGSTSDIESAIAGLLPDAGLEVDGGTGARIATALSST